LTLNQILHQVAVDIVNMKTNITDLSTFDTETKISNMEMKKQVDAMDFITTTIR